MSSFTDQNPFTRITFAQSFGRTLDVLFERIDLFAAVAVVMYVPYTLLQLTFPIHDLTETGGDPFVFLSLFFIQLQSKCVLVGTELAFNGLIGVLGQAAMTVAVAYMYLEKDVRVVDAMRDGARHFGNLLCASALAGVGLIAAFAAGSAVVAALWSSQLLAWLALPVGTVLGGVFVYAWVSLLIVTPVIVVEHKKPWEGLVRAWTLSGGNRCYIFCAFFCLTLTFATVGSIVSLVLFDGIFGTLLKNLPFLFSFPTSSILTTVIYLNMRSEREGLNDEVLSRELECKPPVAYSPVIAPSDMEVGIP